MIVAPCANHRGVEDPQELQEVLEARERKETMARLVLQVAVDSRVLLEILELLVQLETRESAGHKERGVCRDCEEPLVIMALL